MKKFTFLMIGLAAMLSQTVTTQAQVTPPQGVEPAMYVFNGHDTYVDRDKSFEVQIVMDGDQVYIQRLSEYYTAGWVQGTLVNNVLTIPAAYMGTFNFWGDEYALDFDGAEFAYDETANIFSAPDGYTTSVEGELLDEFTNVTLTGAVAEAATPATPTITNFTQDDYGYFVTMDIPVQDVDGNDLYASLLSYQMYYVVDGVTHEYVLTQDNYVFQELETMTEIPYNYTDSYDVDEGGKQVYLYADDIEQWTAFGVKSIYRAGDQVNESPIFWYQLAQTGVNNINEAQPTQIHFVDLQGRKVNDEAHGLLIKIERQADDTVRATKVIHTQTKQGSNTALFCVSAENNKCRPRLSHNHDGYTVAPRPRWREAGCLSDDLLVDSVADSEAVTTLGATTSEHLAAILGFHTSTETMLVSLLQVRGLECTFHCYLMFFNCTCCELTDCRSLLALKLTDNHRAVRKKRCKITAIFQNTQAREEKSPFFFDFSLI